MLVQLMPEAEGDNAMWKERAVSLASAMMPILTWKRDNQDMPLSVRTIRDNVQWFAHFHTGGNPGRHEIDDTQELNYKLVAKTLSELNFQGFIAHEYSPARGSDPIKCLEYAFEIFDV